MRTDLFLRFPDAATALEVARAISGNPEVESLPLDGWLTDPEKGQSTYYVIDVCFGVGQIHEPTGELDGEGNPIMEALSGHHVNGLWMGPEETVPAALGAYRIHPETPAVRFG